MKRLFSTIYLFLFLLAWLPQRSLAGRVSFYGADRIGTTSVTAITQTSDGFLWIGTPRGLLRFDGYRFARAPLLSPAGPLPAEITAFCTDSLDRLWVGMDHGLAVFDRASASFTNIVFPDDLKPRVVRLSVGHGGVVLVGTSGFSSFAVDITSLEAVPAHESLPWPDVDFVEAESVAVPAGMSLDLGDSNVETSFSDRSGNLWLGVQRKGLAQVSLFRDPVFHARSTDDPSLQRLSGGRLLPQSQMPEGAMSFLCDSAGCYWAGTANALWRRRGLADSWHEVAQLPGVSVNLICQLGLDRLAVSTFGAGLALIDRVSGRLVRQLSMHDADSLGHGRLSNDWILSLDTDNDGRLWIATTSGVNCYDPVADDFHPLGWDVLANDNHCTALLALASGDVIFASEHGLRLWSTKNKLTMLKGTEALQGRLIFSMAQDDRGDLWLCTDEGIWRCDADDHKMAAYTSPAQLLRQEFVQAPAVKATDGSIFFRSAEGYLQFLPDSVRAQRRQAGHVCLTTFRIGDKPANALTRSNGKPVMDGATTDCRRFSVSYIDATFSLEFSLLDFTDVDDVSFAYRMEGERQWQQTPRGVNTIYFNHLAPDTYRLQVRAMANGEITPTETYILVVRPPWWRSTLAYFIYALLLVAAVVGGVALYRHSLRSRANEEKLHLLMSAINTQDTPLSLEDMRRAIGSFVQHRREQHRTFGNTEAVLEKIDVQEVKSADEQLMDRIVSSVNRHLDDSEFTVEQLCSEVGISRAHLHRKMKELTGMPVTEFIRNIRLEQAARLLREHKLNVSQVAYSVGFSSIGYFSTAFRKHFGVSPREFN